MTYPPAPMPMPGPGGAMPPKPDSNLVWAILVTILCCLPFGIVAIVKASKVDSLYMSGQYALAAEASASAKKWSIWGLVAGLAVGLVTAIVYVALIATVASTTSTV